jgi:hypothetical protein
VNDQTRLGTNIPCSKTVYRNATYARVQANFAIKTITKVDILYFIRIITVFCPHFPGQWSSKRQTIIIIMFDKSEYHKLNRSITAKIVCFKQNLSHYRGYIKSPSQKISKIRPEFCLKWSFFIFGVIFVLLWAILIIAYFKVL